MILIYLDSANINEIKKIIELGILDGITTNPSLISKENDSFENIIKEISTIFNGPISAEVISTKKEEMIREAIILSQISKNIVIKIPITIDGLKVVNALKEKNIKTNVTLAFSANQALLAAKAGATYVSIFVGRLEDTGHDGVQVVKDTVDIFNLYNIETKVIAASIRYPLHVLNLAKAGTHIITIPFAVIEKMFLHPLTDIGIERFLKDCKNIK